MSQPAPPTIGSRWLALGVLCAATLMVILDGTIVAVALPAIQTDLGFSQSSLAWVVNAYLIAFAGLLLLAGRLGDLVGRKRIFLTGLVVFTAASLLCGVSHTRELLVAARFVQGLGGAMASAVVLGMIVTMFPDPREKTRAVGLYSFVQAAGASIGLIAGGVLTDAASWHWIFFVNVPIGVLATMLAVRLFPAERGIGLAAGADVAGASLVTAGLMLGVYTIVKAADRGENSAHSLGMGALALGLLLAFALRQATAAGPLLPLRVLRSRHVSGANAIVLLLVAGMFGFQFITALYLQRVLGYDAVRTGLAFLPTPMAIAVVSLGFSARLTTRFGARRVLVPGLVLLATGLVLLARVPVDARYTVDVLPVLGLLGVGFGAAMPALMGLAMSGATASDSGITSGLLNTTQQAGGAVGLAILATVATARTNTLLADRTTTALALNGGYRLAFAMAAGFVVAALVVALTVLPAAKPAPQPIAARSAR